MLENNGECWKTAANAAEQQTLDVSGNFSKSDNFATDDEGERRKTTKENGSRRRRRTTADTTMEPRRRSGSLAAIPRDEGPRSKDRRGLVGSLAKETFPTWGVFGSARSQRFIDADNKHERYERPLSYIVALSQELRLDDFIEIFEIDTNA